MRARSGFVSALMALMLVAACGGSGSEVPTESGDESDSPAEPLDPDEVSRALPGRLEVEVDGDADFSFQDDSDLRIVTINRPEVSELTFFSVGIQSFKTVADGAAFRIALDLVGSFRGAGEYEIPAAGQVTAPSVDPDSPDPNAAASGLSKVYLSYSPGGDPLENPEGAVSMQSFEIAVEPCGLRVDDDEGESGRLECPEVAAADGSTVSIVMEWDVT